MANPSPSRSTRPPPPPPMNKEEGDVITNSALIALQRLSEENQTLQAEIRRLRDQMAADRQQHSRLIETYRLTHEEDVQKLQSERKLATSLAAENATLKAGGRKSGKDRNGLTEDVVQQVEREIAILDSHIMRLDSKWNRRSERNQPKSLGDGRRLPLVRQLKALNGDMERILQLLPAPSGATKGRKDRSYDVQNLVEMTAPVTEFAVVKTLEERFVQGDVYTWLGPHLIGVNPFTEPGADCPTLRSHRGFNVHVESVARDAVFRLKETGQSQTVLISGESGSGKTHACHLLVRALHQLPGGTRNADTLKVLSASLSMLQSLGCAWTETNSNSSRMGQFIEVSFDDALVQPQCYWYYVDQARIVRRSPRERNFHIFYQMLSGLTEEEKVQYHLLGYSEENLRYLRCNSIEGNPVAEQERFIHFKNCMDALRIPVADVIRVLASVILLGNIYFDDKGNGAIDIATPEVLKAVSALLAVPVGLLTQGLVKKIRTFRGHTTQSPCTMEEAIMARDSLAKALYVRTVIAMLKRGNSLLRKPVSASSSNSRSSSKMGSPGPTPPPPPLPVPAPNPMDRSKSPFMSRVSTPGSGGAPSPLLSLKTMPSPIASKQESGLMPPQPAPFVGILDLFGFECCHSQENGLGQLCANFCSEMMRNQFKAVVFDSSYDSLRFENVENPFEIRVHSNRPVLDLLVEEGAIFDVLDRESLFVKGHTDSLMSKLKDNLKSNTNFVCSNGDHQHLFGIKHFEKSVIYSPSDFIQDNRDVIYDDLLTIFHKQTCNFKFVTHLFQQDLKNLPQQGTAPKGHYRRILSSAISPKEETRKTLCQDFQSQLNFLVRLMSTSHNHFIRCIKSNANEEPECFDFASVAKQVRSLQILETAQLFVSGLPHGLPFRDFAVRYSCLLPQRAFASPEMALSDCHEILQQLQDESQLASSRHVNWAFGNHSVFFKESIRQQLEQYRLNCRHKAVTLIQSHVRRRLAQSKYRIMRQVNLDRRRILVSERRRGPLHNGEGTGPGVVGVPTPAIPSVPPSQYEMDLVKRTCHIHGLDVDVPPPIPATRPYTVKGGVKLNFPHQRMMRQNYQSGTERNAVLMKGETVRVVGPSHRRGYLLVEQRGMAMNVPSSVMDVAVPGSDLEGTSDL